MNNQRKKNVLTAVALQQGPGGINREVRALNRELSGYRPLIAPAFLNAPGTHGRTSLMYAAHTGDVARLNQLLEGHANPNLVDERGFNALIYAAHGGHVPCVLALLERGANPNLADRRGFTPLMHAVGSGRVPCVQVLLQRGANPNLAAHYPPDEEEEGHNYNDLAVRNGYTAVVLAALRGEAQTVGMLQEAGASLVLPNGRTVIQAACLGKYEIDDDDILRLRAVLNAGIAITPQDIEAAFHINDDDGGGGSPHQYPFIRVLMQGLIRQVPDRDERLAILLAANLAEGRDAVDIINNIPGAEAQEMHQRRRKSRRRKSRSRRRRTTKK